MEATRRSFNKDFLLALAADFKKHGRPRLRRCASNSLVIALNNQPQGGIINRPRSPDVRVARRDDFGFGWGWLGFNNTPGRGGQYYDPRQNNRNYYQRSQRWF